MPRTSRCGQICPELAGSFEAGGRTVGGCSGGSCDLLRYTTRDRSVFSVHGRRRRAHPLCGGARLRVGGLDAARAGIRAARDARDQWLSNGMEV